MICTLAALNMFKNYSEVTYARHPIHMVMQNEKLTRMCEPSNPMHLLAGIKASQLGLQGTEWPLLCSSCHYPTLQPHTNPIIAVVKHNILYLTAMPLYPLFPLPRVTSPCSPPFFFCHLTVTQFKGHSLKVLSDLLP